MVNLHESKWAPASARHANQSRHNNKDTTVVSDSPYAPSTLHLTTAAATTNGNSLNTSSISSASSKTIRDLLQRRSALQKFVRLVRRLKWKSRALLYSYHRARDPDERRQTVVGSVAFPMDVGVDAPGSEAEMMFKVDFFEFYVLLERVLVLLLGVCGSVIVGGGNNPRTTESSVSSRTKESEKVNATVEGGKGQGGPRSLRELLVEEARRLQPQPQPRGRTGVLGDSIAFHGYAHRFHANVLAALDQPDHPLHQTLGHGEARTYLGIAKEFRNRWKDAEEKPADRTEDGLVGSRYEKVLHDLKLEDMLCTILKAVDAATIVAEEEINRFARNVDIVQWGGDSATAATIMAMELDEDNSNRNAPWEAMPDVMDWEIDLAN